MVLYVSNVKLLQELGDLVREGRLEQLESDEYLQPKIARLLTSTASS